MYFSQKVKQDIKNKIENNVVLAVKTFNKDLNEAIKIIKKLPEDLKLEEPLNIFEFQNNFKKIPQDLRADTVLVFDTETTGLVGYVVSIALILYSIKEDKILEEFYIELNPQVKIEKEATKQHKITEKKIKNAPIFVEVWEDKIKPFFDKADFFVGQNLEFDLRTIARELERMKVFYPLNKKVFDTMFFTKNIVNAKGVNGRIKNASLAEIIEFFDIKLDDYTFHNSFVDTKATLEIFRVLLNYKKE